MSKVLLAAIPMLRYERFSCNALRTALRNEGLYREVAARHMDRIEGLMDSCGLVCATARLESFRELEDHSDPQYGATKETEASQFARALWLTWLAMIADEEGLQIEDF